MLAQRRAQRRAQPRLAQLHRRQVDRHRHRARCPRAASAAAGGRPRAMIHAPMATISPDSSAIGMKSAGGISPRCGCCQRTRLSTPQRPSGIDARLVVQHQLVALDRVAQVVFDLQPPHTRSFISRVKNCRLSRPPALAWYIATSACRISSSMSSPSPGNMAMPTLHDTCSSRRPLVRLADQPDQPLVDDRADFLCVADAVEDAPRTRRRPAALTVSPSRTSCSRRCDDRPQQRVADMVAERVVDVLEAVQVDEQHGHPVRRCGAPLDGAASRVRHRRGWAGRSARRAAPCSRCAPRSSCAR